MKIIFFTILILACSEKTSSENLLKNYDIFENAYQELKLDKFKSISLSGFEYKLDTKMLNQKVLKQIQNLDIESVERHKEGLFFVTGKTTLGQKGFFRSEILKDSLNNFESLIHVKENWYLWFQD